MLTIPSSVRVGLTLPPTLSLAFESLGPAENVMTMINTMFDPSVTTADIEWLRSHWSGSIVVKGVQRIDDARAVVSAGADGIAVSNHGGRQLDRAVTPLELLPGVVGAVGDSAEVYLDGGVRAGADVAVAVAFGARAVFLGRPYLYALMAGGEPGVDHLLTLLRDDYTRTLKLLGATSTSELTRDLVTLTAATPTP